jgi:hypothetical protein
LLPGRGEVDIMGGADTDVLIGPAFERADAGLINGRIRLAGGSVGRGDTGLLTIVPDTSMMYTTVVSLTMAPEPTRAIP